MSLNYNTHEKTEGIGYIGDKTLGVNIHSCLAVSTEGLAMGILDQMSYNRVQSKDDSRSHDSKKTRPLREKESCRWVQTLWESTSGLPDGMHTVTVCGREGDMYALFDGADRWGKAFLIRIAQNRTTAENHKIREKQCMGKIKTAIPRDSRKGIAEREAVLQIRYGAFEIKRPLILNKNKKFRDTQEVNIIYVKEEGQDKAVEPLEWFFFFFEKVESAEDAYEKTAWYMHRWKIQRFHYVLKSGCTVEKLQERSMDKTRLLVLMYSVIAVVIMNMTYIAGIRPQEPCTIFFEEEEWKALYCTANKTKKAPRKPYSIQEAVTYLGRLGGPKRAPSDGPPGVKTIWLGLDKLNTLLAYKEWMP
jgi:hypothetical protein